MNLVDIKFYNSGALSDGSSQSNINHSLGGYRAGDEIVNKKDATAPSTITGVTIDFASVANANGTGTLTYTFATKSLQWTANGDSIGLAVPFTVDATRTLYSNDESKFIQVTVDFSALPGGAMGPDTITISENSGTLNNIFPDIKVADALSGIIAHRAIFMQNTHDTQGIAIPKMFISQATSHPDEVIAFALEDPSNRVNGFIQTIATETTDPIGLTWNRVTTQATAIAFPGKTKILANNFVGIWFRRTIAPTSAKIANNVFKFKITGDVPGIDN